MADIVLEGAFCLDGKRRTVLIEDGLISEIRDRVESGSDSDRTIDCSSLLLMPGLCNSHTHSAMSLLRGVGEDMELDPWLKERIWPLEARMEGSHIKSGMALACLEMIRTGTTLFNDMYFKQWDGAGVVEKMGMRAVLGEGFLDLFDEEKREEGIRDVQRSLDAIHSMNCSRITSSLAPHAVYTVSDEALNWFREKATEDDIPLHIHMAETREEVEGSVSRTGRTPMGHLEDISFLSSDVCAAHGVHLSDEDLRTARSRGVTLVHVPASNMKLSVGGQIRHTDVQSMGINMSLGTDGAASNNSLDMFQTMKISALLCKQTFGASSVKAEQVIENATRAGYRSMGLNGGVLEEGALADLILVDMNHPSMVPMNDPLSNIVYSCSGGATKYSIIDGRLIMENGRIKDEDSIVREAGRASLDLMEAENDG